MSNELSILYAKRTRFSADARVAGVLVNADIGPVCWGELHGADRPPGQEFVRFEAVGVDNRNGWEPLKTPTPRPKPPQPTRQSPHEQAPNPQRHQV